MKIYVVITRCSWKRKDGVKTWWNSFYHKNWWFFKFHKLLNAIVFFYKLKKIFTKFMTKFRVLVLCFPYFVDHSIICIDSPNIYIYIYNTYKDNYNSLCTLCTYGILSLNSFQTLDMLSFHLIFITRKHNLFNYKKKKKKKTPFAPLSD